MESSEGPQAQQPPQTEEELQQRLDEEMRRVRVEDLLLQSVAGIINLTARRIAKEDEQDLEQGRIGIEAVRALADLLPGEAQTQVRQALSELQMLYAKAAGGGDEAGDTGDRSADSAAGSPEQRPQSPPKGPEPPSRLWTPGRG